VVYDGVYERRLEKSLEREQGDFRVLLTDPKLSLTESRNSIGDIEEDYVVFFHEDVILLEGGRFFIKLEEMCDKLKDLGVGGVFGFPGQKGMFYKTMSRMGRTPFELIEIDGNESIKWLGEKYSVKRFGKDIAHPVVVDTIDDQVVIIPREVWNKVKYDTDTFSFQLSGEDYCMRVRTELGLKVYSLPLLTWRIKSYARKIHTDLGEKKGVFRNKWKKYLPIHTIYGKMS